MDKDLKKQLIWIFWFFLAIFSFCAYLIIPMFLDGVSKAIYLAIMEVISYIIWTFLIAYFLMDWLQRREIKKRNELKIKKQE